jgi:hypothetical protein
MFFLSPSLFFIISFASSCFFFVSAALASKNCCGTPLGLFCALRRSVQSSFINLPVFFSMNPVSVI